MDASSNGQGPHQTPRRLFSFLTGWAKVGLGVLVAAFFAATVAAALPVGDTAREAIFATARAANVAVLVTWAVRWRLRWRRTRSDAVSAMGLSARSQRLVRGCVAVLLVLLVVLGASGGGGVSGWPLLPRLVYVLTFAGAGLTALLVVKRGVAAPNRQIRGGSNGDEGCQP